MGQAWRGPQVWSPPAPPPAPAASQAQPHLLRGPSPLDFPCLSLQSTGKPQLAAALTAHPPQVGLPASSLCQHSPQPTAPPHTAAKLGMERWRDSEGLCGPAAQPTVLPGPGAKHTWVQILTGQCGRAWLVGGRVFPIGRGLLGTRISPQGQLQGPVRSTNQLWALSPPATPGPPIPKSTRPRHRVVAQALRALRIRTEKWQGAGPRILGSFLSDGGGCPGVCILARACRLGGIGGGGGCSGLSRVPVLHLHMAATGWGPRTLQPNSRPKGAGLPCSTQSRLGRVCWECSFLEQNSGPQALTAAMQPLEVTRGGCSPWSSIGSSSPKTPHILSWAVQQGCLGSPAGQISTGQGILRDPFQADGSECEGTQVSHLGALSQGRSWVSMGTNEAVCPQRPSLQGWAVREGRGNPAAQWRS